MMHLIENVYDGAMGLAVRDIGYFLEIQKRGSLTAAARALGVAQPSLSVAVQRLEEHFKTTLLTRGRGGIELTSTGIAFAEDAQKIVEALVRVEHRIAGLEGEEVGNFVIGCHESLGAYFLPKFLNRFFIEHPGINVTLKNDSSANVRDFVIRREVDFGLIVNPVAHPDLALVPLFVDAMDFFIASRLQTSTLALSSAYEMLRRGPLIHAGRVTESRFLIDGLEREGVVPKRTLSCGDFELVKALVLAGVGIGLLPRRVAAYGHGGKIERLHAKLPSYADKIYAVYRGDLHRTRAATVLKDAIVEYGKQLK